MKIMVPLVALRPMRYGTRHLKPGDLFHAPRSQVRLLTVLKKASESVEPAKVEKPRKAAKPAAPAHVETQYDPLDALRAEYQASTGRTADKRWGEARLRSEIEASSSVEEDTGDIADPDQDAEPDSL